MQPDVTTKDRWHLEELRRNRAQPQNLSLTTDGHRWTRMKIDLVWSAAIHRRFENKPSACFVEGLLH